MNTSKQEQRQTTSDVPTVKYKRTDTGRLVPAQDMSRMFRPGTKTIPTKIQIIERDIDLGFAGNLGTYKKVKHARLLFKLKYKVPTKRKHKLLNSQGTR